MIKEEVKHIFARSACLTRKQFEAYLAGNMITEEIYGVEHHINGCPLCSMAMDGMQLRKDALVVASSINSDFLKEHLEAMQEPVSSGAASYVKNLKPGSMSAKPLLTGLKIGIAVAACAGILWFVQSIGKNSKAEAQLTRSEPVANETVQPEEGSVVVEEPLVADNQVPATTEPPAEETQLIEEAPETSTAPPVEQKPVATAPVKKEDPKKDVSTKPVTPLTAKTTQPVPPKKEEQRPATAKKDEKKPATTAAAKPEPARTAVLPASPPPVKEVAKEQPREEPEHKPAPKTEEPKPQTQPAAKKEEPADELPSDPLAAGKVLMEKRSYSAAINKMRNEMRSNNKNRRQEAVMMVARCYQALGNKERAKELLSSIVDEGGPEKKNAKKLLKEVDKDAKAE